MDCGEGQLIPWPTGGHESPVEVIRGILVQLSFFFAWPTKLGRLVPPEPIVPLPVIAGKEGGMGIKCIYLG